MKTAQVAAFDKRKSSTFAAMMMKTGIIKGRTLYVSDMDGTLLGEDSRLSAATVTTLNRIIGEMGGLFTVATARTPATVVPLMQEVNARLPFIVIGGSAMWNPVTAAAHPPLWPTVAPGRALRQRATAPAVEAVLP